MPKKVAFRFYFLIYRFSPSLALVHSQPSLSFDLSPLISLLYIYNLLPYKLSLSDTPLAGGDFKGEAGRSGLSKDIFSDI